MKELRGLFFFSYFGLGAMLPLLSLYLKDQGFSGVEIGSLSSIRALAAIFAPPVWGLLSDRYNIHKRLLIIAILVTLTITIGLPFATSVIGFALIYGLFNIFQIAINPLSDSIAIHSPIPFGSIRKWGAYGFAFAAAIAGILTTFLDLTIIFPLFSLSLLICLFFATKLKFQIESIHPPSKRHFYRDLKILLRNRQFLIFLLFTVLTGNTLIAHSTFYGPLFEEVGGTKFFLGIAFFLFAISEAPFMQVTQRFIQKFGIHNVLLFSTLSGAIRWFFYALGPSPIIMLILFPLQGLFFGTFLASGAEYIKMTVQPSVRSTAITIYSAVFIGVGAALSNLIGGYIYEYINIFAVYTFLGTLCLLGLLTLLSLKKVSLQSTQ